MAKKHVTWADRTPTRELEDMLPKLQDQHDAAQELVEELLDALNTHTMREDYPELAGAQVIAEAVRDRARDTVALVRDALEGRTDRFDLNDAIDSILGGDDGQ